MQVHHSVGREMPLHTSPGGREWNIVWFCIVCTFLEFLHVCDCAISHETCTKLNWIAMANRCLVRYALFHHIQHGITPHVNSWSPLSDRLRMEWWKKKFLFKYTHVAFDCTLCHVLQRLISLTACTVHTAHTYPFTHSLSFLLIDNSAGHTVRCQVR